MHQNKNTLSFRCVRFVKRIDGETYLLGLSFILATVLTPLKGYLRTDALDQLASIKKPIGEIFLSCSSRKFLDECRRV